MHPSPGGLFDHGRKLLDLMKQCGHDFDDLNYLSLPAVPPEDFDADGRYQLSLFDHRRLVRQCRELGLALQLHPDRGDLMQRRPPGEARDYLRRLMDEFDCLSGGSWLYLEVDPGFPWPNVRAMFETAMELRTARR